MRMVSGLIELKEDYEERIIVPAGKYVSAKEYCNFTGEKLNTVRVRIARGKIPSYSYGAKRVIPIQTLRNFGQKDEI